MRATLSRRAQAAPRAYRAPPADALAELRDPATLPGALRFSWHDFSRVRELLRAATGIALSPEKKAMVYARLAKRVRDLHLTEFSTYVALLEDPAHPEWDAFVSALTTNLTSFFREPHHFPILAELARRVSRSELFTVWSAGCATGEEPYSIAICLADAFGRMDAPARIVATDIDSRVLAVARKGIYARAAVDRLPEANLRRYLLRGTGENAGQARVRPEIARLVSFASMNLRDEHWHVPGPFDAIFCRNVMIYLDREVQRRILERFAARLKPHGLLFTGHSENLFFIAADLFRLRGKTAYEMAARSS